MRQETRDRYPLNWKQISRHTIQARGDRCEDQDAGLGPCNGPLTVHHIDYDPGNNELHNLAVLCASHHLKRQAADLREATKSGKSRRLIALGQLPFPGLEPPRARSWREAAHLRESTNNGSR